MKISVLVPTLGERISEIKRLIHSIENQSYKNVEIIVVTQDNHEEVSEVLSSFQRVEIRQISLERKGLSYARNEGIRQCSGDIIILSDDDCWYPEDSFRNIIKAFSEYQTDVLLTQIKDPAKGVLYKKYGRKKSRIRNKLQLMSKSSIEIAFLSQKVDAHFDERFGLGAQFVCGEEVDFLLQNFPKARMLYLPIVTVYHPKKDLKRTDKQIAAKGALYAKNFDFMVASLVLLRDLMIRHENNFKPFFHGYYKIKKGVN